eukprot:TRINITY_DN47415_c0_g1_i1.p1 TRINITY_DN47415_c0_g1~~TRINITY_DN47415_c0_g1_i1.p1  ORF type:complete len:629 (+),score=180.14 TRINITY_DN47415_c0_g1_i1:84-1889(+)
MPISSPSAGKLQQRPQSAGPCRTPAQPRPPSAPSRGAPGGISSSSSPRQRPLSAARAREWRWQRERALTAHDEEYIGRHGLAAKLGEAWDNCLRQKPAEPLSYLADKLHPTQTRRAVLQLQQELDDAVAQGGLVRGNASPRGRRRVRVRAVSDQQVEAVRESFSELVKQPTLTDEVWLELAAISPHAAALLRAHDDECSDAACRLLPLLRLATDHLDRLGTVEGFLRGAGRRHLSAGVTPADYAAVTAALLRVVRRWAARRADERAAEQKRAWLKLYGFASTAMAAGAEGVALHPTHRSSLEPQPDEIRHVRESLARLKDRAGAGTAVARVLLDICPRAAEVLKRRGTRVPRLGHMLIDAADLVSGMLAKRGPDPAIAYLAEVGVRHEENYKVGRELYPFVGQALLAALDHSLGREAEDEATLLSRAWQRALDLIFGILADPLPEGTAVPTAEILAVSDLSGETPLECTNVEADMAAVARGRATPTQGDDEGDAGSPPRHGAREGESGEDPAARFGDVSNVPVGDRQLRALFERYDRRKLNWLSRDTVVRIYMSQESFGLPVTKAQAERQVDDLLRKYSTRGDGRVTFEEFSIVMLKVAQR